MTDHIDIQFSLKWGCWTIIRAVMVAGVLTRIDTKPWFEKFVGWIVSKGFRYEVATNDRS